MYSSTAVEGKHMLDEGQASAEENYRGGLLFRRTINPKNIPQYAHNAQTYSSSK